MRGRKGPLRLDERDDSREVVAAAGQEFELRLEENPTAGFRWTTLSPGEPVCALLDHGYKPGTRPGQPGVHFWRFKFVGPGKARIELEYRRVWERDTGAARAFRLKVCCDKLPM